MKRIYEATGKTVDEAIDLACAQAGVGLDEAEIEVLEFGSKGFFGIGGKDAKVRFTVCSREDKADRAKTLKNEVKANAVNTEKRESAEKTKAKGDSFGAKNSKEFKPAKKRESAEAPSSPRTQNPVIEYDEETITKTRIRVMSFLEPVFSALQVKPESDISYKEGVLLFSFNGQGLGSLIGRRGETLNAIQYLTNLAVNRQAEEHVRIVLDVEGYRHGREETLIHLARKMAEKAVRTGRRVELEPMNPNERRVVHLALQEDNRVETLSKGEEPYRRVVISSRRNSRNR